MPSATPVPQPNAAIVEIQARLAEWFIATARPLPWRAVDRTPWGVLVSEVMSQQTPVPRVEPIWLDWMARWPTPADVAAAPTADILRAWGSLGYPRRALRLQECARAIVTDHAGVVPHDDDSLRALPGVGVYTAAAIIAFAFGRRSAVLDTNVRRVLARVLSGTALPAPSMTASEAARAAAIVPVQDEAAALWAASSMELGALVCTSRTPDCTSCPIADLCAWRAEGYPPDEHTARRRTQAWTGTDRQVRGTVMKALRSSSAPVLREQIDMLWPDTGQLRQCVVGLIEDGLIEEVHITTTHAHPLPAYRLPE
jgi:A/G-specific adenine glycosylase